MAGGKGTGVADGETETDARREAATRGEDAAGGGANGGQGGAGDRKGQQSDGGGTAAKKSGLTWKAPETYLAFLALIGTSVIIAVLLSNTNGSDAQWGRFLSVANGPGAVFIAILGAILGFSVNQFNVNNAKSGQEKAENERTKAQQDREKAERDRGQADSLRVAAEKDAESSRVKVAAVRGMLDVLPDEIERRRGDASAFVPQFDSQAEAMLQENFRVGGDFRLARAQSTANIDPLLEQVAGVVKAAHGVLGPPVSDPRL